jgi:hypothetical protein
MIHGGQGKIQQAVLPGNKHHLKGSTMAEEKSQNFVVGQASLPAISEGNKKLAGRDARTTVAVLLD